MKKITFLAGLLFMQHQIADAQTNTFIYTGSVQTYTVPACVTSVTVDVQGAQGGLGPMGINSIQGTGGLGGRTEATILVNPGDVLTIYVGGAGAPDNNTSAAGGFNGGGNAMAEASYTYYGGGGGGGASDIRLNGNALTDRIVVAGGGGGAGADGCTADGLSGGEGGGLIANPGQPGSVCVCNPSGQGGTQAAGGVKGDWGCSCDAMPGTLGFGGNSNSTGCGGPTGGGGGGGGYYGGGGGGLGAGGGGSNYTIGTATGVVNTIGFRSGDGIVMITPNSGAPNPGAITGSTSICQNSSGNYSIASMVGATSYTWSVPAGTVINSGQGTTSINITAGNTSGNISVTATFPCGTSGPTSLAITINALPTVVANTTASAVCAGSSVTLTGSGATTYTWDNSVMDGVAFNPAATLTYMVTGTDANGCQDVDMITVTVNPLPTVVANTTASTVCAGSSVTLTGSGATSYTWDNSVMDGVAFNPASTTTYMVTGTDGNGCQDTDVITVTVNALPTVTLNFPTDTVCVNGGNFNLTGESPSGGVWSGTGVTGSVLDPTVPSVGFDLITYMFTDVNGCSAQDTSSLWIDVCNGVVENNSFTNLSVFPNPNNGTFTITADANIGDLVIVITDMQGRVVYSANEKNVQAGYAKQISLGKVSSGLYMMHVTTNGEERTEKISIQK